VVESEEFGPEGTELTGTLPQRYVATFEPFSLAGRR
jgi:hypothetical protein